MVAFQEDLGYISNTHMHGNSQPSVGDWTLSSALHGHQDTGGVQTYTQGKHPYMHAYIYI